MDGVTFYLAIVGLALWGVVFGLTAWGTWLATRRLATPPPHLDAPFNLFPVSIVKPLKGVDDTLEANLESFFRLDYPDYELLFSVASASDPARWVAARLMRRYPRVKARIFVGETLVGPNPKVNNMLKAYEGASHDWTLISDSSVRVSPDGLKRLVAHLRPGVGLVTSVVVGQMARSWGGRLEAVYLNTFYARGMSVADGLGKTCVIGKCMLFQRSVATRFGGLRFLGQYLAEDFMAGEAMRELGFEVVISTDPVKQIIGDYTFESFWKRHLRWGRIRKQHSVSAFVLEPFTGVFAAGVVGAFSSSALLGWSMPVFMMMHLSAWSACDAWLMHRLGARLRWSTPVAWFLREALALPLWLHIASGNTVEWRGNKLAIRSGGILET